MPARRSSIPSPHSAQPLSSTSVSLVEANTWPAALQLRAQLAVVVDAAVEDDGEAERLVDHRLRAARRQVDDREPPVREPDRPVDPDALRRPARAGRSTACMRASAARSGAPSRRSSPAKPHIARLGGLEHARAPRLARPASRRARGARAGRRAPPRATARRARAARSVPSIALDRAVGRPGDRAQARCRAARRAWWWKEFTGSSTAPQELARAASRGAIRTSWVVDVARLVSGGASIEPSVTSGRCWCSVPPRATLSACMPRQMPRMGSPSRVGAPRDARARTRRARARSGPSSGCGGAP